MKNYFPFIVAVLLILGIAACAPAAPATEAVSPTEPAASEGPFHPLTTQTGIESIDQVLTAVSSGDAAGLRSLVEFTNAVCTQQEGLGGDGLRGSSRGRHGRAR